MRTPTDRIRMVLLNNHTLYTRMTQYVEHHYRPATPSNPDHKRALIAATRFCEEVLSPTITEGWDAHRVAHLPPDTVRELVLEILPTGQETETVRMVMDVMMETE